MQSYSDTYPKCGAYHLLDHYVFPLFGQPYFLCHSCFHISRRCYVWLWTMVDHVPVYVAFPGTYYTTFFQIQIRPYLLIIFRDVWPLIRLLLLYPLYFYRCRTGRSYKRFQSSLYLVDCRHSMGFRTWHRQFYSNADTISPDFRCDEAHSYQFELVTVFLSGAIYQ